MPIQEGSCAAYPDVSGRFLRWPRERPAGSASPRSGHVPAVAALTTVATLVVSILVMTGPAGAAEGIYLSWDGCRAASQNQSNRNFACDQNGTQQELFVEFTMPQAADNVVAIETVIDIQHANQAMPDWWRFDEGGCRAGPTVSADVLFPAGCANMWQPNAEQVVGGIADYVVSLPHGLASQARLRVTQAVLTEYALTVDATTMYAAARIVIHDDNTTGVGACAGCGEPACLVLNSVLVGRIAGSYLLQTPGPNNANWVTWQGGSGADCAAVPVRKQTWGMIKSLYRQGR